MAISGLEWLLEHYHDDVVDLPDRERGGVEEGRHLHVSKEGPSVEKV